MSFTRALLPPSLGHLADTARPYPDRTIHALFAAQAAARPDAPAVRTRRASLSYGRLAERVNRLAHVLLAHGLGPEDRVAVMLERSLVLPEALLGILAAGGAYVPIHDALPPARVRHVLRECGARVLVGAARHVRAMNKLQWECPDLDVVLCLDSQDVHGEVEETGEMMRLDTWEHIRRGPLDEVSGGGFRSSYTGELLPDEVMADFAANVETKVGRLVGPTSRILEVGCASGISLFRLAPRVARYVGTDLEPDILRWTGARAAERGLDNVRLECLLADQLGRLDEGGFDVVVMNSVVQCFSGHNYLRRALRQAIDAMAESGWIFLGNVWDEARREAFERSLIDHARAHAGEGHRTKTDRSEDLFLATEFFHDLRHDLPEIAAVEASPMLGTSTSELSLYAHDVLLRVDKRDPRPPAVPRTKLQLDRRALDAAPAEPPPAVGDGRSLAYVMYTSGTTGDPKGAMIEHKSVVRLVVGTDYVDLGPDDRLLQAGAVAFDASTYEIWGALLNGGCVVLPEKETLLDARRLRELLVAQEVTSTFLTATLFNTLTQEDPTLFASLRTLLVGGERLSPEHVARVRRACPDLRLVNGYGPTENTTFTTWYEIGEVTGDVPLGRPIANSRVYVLRSDGAEAPPRPEPVAIGEVGELYAAGDGLARGYLADHELTAARFFTFPEHPEERLYRTGDLAAFRADGVLEYHGRIDDQVKVRGFRIEPAEVTVHLECHPEVREAAVVARRDDAGAAELVAYYASPAPLDVADLRGHLASLVPDYMVPSHWVHLERLPMNANGKLDRDALPPPARAETVAAEAPANELESALRGIWEEVLGARGFGVTDDFFALGGDSLKVTRLAALARKRLARELPLTLVYEASTIRELARHLEAPHVETPAGTTMEGGA